MYKFVVGARFVGRAALARPRESMLLAALTANCGSAALRTVYRASLGAWDEGRGWGGSRVFRILYFGVWRSLLAARGPGDWLGLRVSCGRREDR